MRQSKPILQNPVTIHPPSTHYPSSTHLLELLLEVGSISFADDAKPETGHAVREIPMGSVSSAPQLVIRQGTGIQTSI